VRAADEPDAHERGLRAEHVGVYAVERVAAPVAVAIAVVPAKQASDTRCF
jgi:hypothetical protein